MTWWHENAFNISGPLADSHHEGPVMLSFDVSFAVSLNKLLNKQLSSSDLRRLNIHVIVLTQTKLGWCYYDICCYQGAMEKSFGHNLDHTGFNLRELLAKNNLSTLKLLYLNETEKWSHILNRRGTWGNMISTKNKSTNSRMHNE